MVGRGDIVYRNYEINCAQIFAGWLRVKIWILRVLNLIVLRVREAGHYILFLGLKSREKKFALANICSSLCN